MTRHAVMEWAIMYGIGFVTGFLFAYPFKKRRHQGVEGEAMTQPTQAQIEAGKSELRRIFQDAYTDQTLTIAVKAVLAAAAEVGPILKKHPVMWRVMDDNVWRVFSDEKEAQDYADKIGMKNYQGLYVREGTERHLSPNLIMEGGGAQYGGHTPREEKRIVAATIERCAQVIDKRAKAFGGDGKMELEALAAAIRALKDQP